METAYLIDVEGYYIDLLVLEDNRILMTEIEEEVPEVVEHSEKKTVTKLVPRMDVVYPHFVGNEDVYVAELPDGLFKPQFDFETRQWKNGLSDEKIEEIKNQPVPKSPLDIIGEQLVEKDIKIMELEAQNEDLGQQIVEKDIQILQLETQTSDIGQQIVDLDIRLLEGGL